MGYQRPRFRKRPNNAVRSINTCEINNTISGVSLFDGWSTTYTRLFLACAKSLFLDPVPQSMHTVPGL